MQEEDMDISLKVIVVGNGMVGKTSLITRFARGIRTDTYKKTIGTDFMEKEITVRATGERVKLMLWDTAGQEMFSKLTRSYYKGSGGVVYAFSTVDRESFLEIERWKQKVESECGPISAVLVQNKIDLLDEATVTNQEVEDLARKLNLKLYRTCVRDNLLVDDVFDYLAESFLARGGAASLDDEPVAHIGDPIGSNDNSSPKDDEKQSNNTTNNNSSNNSTPASNPSSNTVKVSDSQSKPNNTTSSSTSGTVQLQPLTQRTGGKKKPCIIQ